MNLRKLFLSLLVGLSLVSNVDLRAYEPFGVSNHYVAKTMLVSIFVTLTLRAFWDTTPSRSRIKIKSRGFYRHGIAEGRRCTIGECGHGLFYTDGTGTYPRLPKGVARNWSCNSNQTKCSCFRHSDKRA